MNKLEANISLFFITFFASIQYVFLIWVPDSVSHFAFLCITNLVGLFMALAFFFGELFRLDVKQVWQSVTLAAELMVFNIFLLLGVRGLGSTLTNAMLSTNFVFIAVIMFILYKHIPDKGTLYGIIAVFVGLLILAEVDVKELWSVNALYLMLSNVAFALYIVSVGEYSGTSNPSIIAMGQMFFCFLFSLVFWAGEVVFFGASFTLPKNPAFWGSVIYISFFIRGLYGIVQVYAQRYTTPLNTSLIFSTEIIMTLLTSPLIARFLGTKPEIITWPKIFGGVVIVLGICMTEPQFFAAVRRIFVHEGSARK